jgi:hypothetical protein
MTAIVGAFQVIVHSSYVGWVLLSIIALAIASAIAFHDGSRVRRAEEQAALELLRR